MRHNPALGDHGVAQHAGDIAGDIERQLVGAPPAGDPQIQIAGTPIVGGQGVRPSCRSAGTSAPDRPGRAAGFAAESKRSPPPTSKAALALTCIGPCGPSGSGRHMPGSPPCRDSTPSTAKAMRSSSPPLAGPKQVDRGLIARRDAAHDRHRRLQRIGKADRFRCASAAPDRPARAGSAGPPRSTVTCSAPPRPKLTVCALAGWAGGGAGLPGPRITRTDARERIGKGHGLDVDRAARHRRRCRQRARVRRVAACRIAGQCRAGAARERDRGERSRARRAYPPSAAPHPPGSLAGKAVGFCARSARRGKRLGNGEGVVTRCGTPRCGACTDQPTPRNPP